ncbi:MAG: carbamoyltransferase HypF, partial [Bacteroidetes bacterium]
WPNYLKLIKKDNNIKTSSIGRLFDAVASLLKLKDINSFEGEAAMILENEALSFYRENKNYKEAYSTKYENSLISVTHIVDQIIKDIKTNTNKNEIAFKFHLSLVQVIKLVADNYSVKNIAFSGGVFQNSLLIDLINQYLGNDYKLHFHQQLSANDENISYGQLVYINNKIK